MVVKALTPPPGHGPGGPYHWGGGGLGNREPGSYIIVQYIYIYISRLSSLKLVQNFLEKSTLSSRASSAPRSWRPARWG